MCSSNHYVNYICGDKNCLKTIEKGFMSDEGKKEQLATRPKYNVGLYP